jgi:hypothetical protein
MSVAGKPFPRVPQSSNSTAGYMQENHNERGGAYAVVVDDASRANI